MPARPDRVAGGLVGLLIGDALGVPYEFHPAHAIPPPDLIDFRPPRSFHRSHGSVPPGTWSDDGAQALCLLDTLLECGRLDLEQFAARLLDWRHHGYMAVDNVVFDCGIQTGAALAALRAGTAPHEAGPRDEYDNGNGSLMRVLPLALWHRGADEDLVADAMAQSLVTHGHVRSQVCCALYCLWARRVLEDDPAPWASAVGALRSVLRPGSSERRELDDGIRPDEALPGHGSGYVIDCLRAARMVVERGGDYEAVVKTAVALGEDTDTTAAIAGGIAGLRVGLEAIPARWRRNLRGRELYEPLLARLIRL